jgi:Helicase HerA, central domain
MGGRDDDITMFAETDWRGQRRRFGIKRKDRRAHLYVVGKTGMGKSTLLETLIASDLKCREGLAVIDPHGDLVTLVALVPPERGAQFINFDPASRPLAFNPLDTPDPDRRHLVASGLVSAFKKLWADSWGPRLEYLLGNALVTLLERPGSTLLDVPKLLADKAYRQAVPIAVTDIQLKEFWRTEYDQYLARFRAEAIVTIQNKVGQFLASPVIRALLGQPRSSLDLRQVMDEGQILLPNPSKGKLGEDMSALLGALLITGLEQAALSRVEIPEASRRDFYCYVDEAHSFQTLSLADLLPEARKFRLNLILAHQYLEEVDECVRAAIFGNVGTLIAFRIRAGDAEELAREFFPVCTAEDFQNLPPYTVYLRLMVDSVMSRGLARRPCARNGALASDVRL